MRILVLDSDYLQFLRWLYGSKPGLQAIGYEEQLDVRRRSLFGTAPSYAAAFRELGHEAAEIFVNNGPMQINWASEHGLSDIRPRTLRRRSHPRELVRRAAGGWRGVPEFLLCGVADHDLMARILVAQVESFQPDLVLNQDIGALSSSVVREIRAHTRILVGQHAASPIDAAFDIRPYDLLISSFPPTVEEFKRRGGRAELNRLGFDVEVLAAIGPSRPTFDWGLTFVGGLGPIHSSRIEFLEEVAHLVADLRIWSSDPLPRRSILRSRYMGAAWGRKMFEILRSSRATINHHGDIAPYANNMRLFEATGAGTLLMTDAKKNLSEIFVPGAEVLEYASASDCAAEYNGLDQVKRDEIAANGQRRTLRDHRYVSRVQQLLRSVDMLVGSVPHLDR